MPLQSKRRRLSLLTLPVVVVVGFLLVATLAAWQRSDFIADLSDCISHGETRDAIEAVHKLAALPNPPIPLLVTAAASDEHETAGAAQVSIDRLLRRWQRDVESKKRYSTVASQLSELAESLAETQKNFSDSDHAWLESAVRKILRIANKLPTAKTPLVAARCDTVLSAIGAGRLAARMEELSDIDDFDGRFTGVPHDTDSPRPDSMRSTDGGQNDQAQPGETARTPFEAPATAEPLRQSDDDTADNGPSDLPINELRNRGSGSDGATASDRSLSGLGLPQRSVAAPPIFRILPAAPISQLPSDGTASLRLTPESRSSAKAGDDVSNGPLAGADSRELLKTWVVSENGDSQSIERELARRGFGTLSKQLVRQFFSDNPQDRVRLVDKVLAQPGGGSEAWLLLLAGDSDPDVRLFAVTFMATSNNAALMEKAWQLAIRDRDPRVADLAVRLRERRDGPLRR